MNVLLLVTELNSANGICARTVAKAMAQKGYKVFCVTNYEGEVTPEDNDINYRFVRPRLTYRLLQKNNPIMCLLATILNKAKLLLTYPIWPWISPSYTNRIYRAAMEICSKNKIDFIIPIYTQIDTLIAAQRIKECFPSIQYVPYFLDALSAGYGPKYFSAEWTRKRGFKWERRLLSNADIVIMMESARRHYEQYGRSQSYFKKIKYLDLPLVSAPVHSSDERNNKETVELCYVGSLPANIRNPEPFFRLFSATTAPSLRLRIVGKNSNDRLLCDYAEKDSRIILEAALPHEKAQIRIAEADILVDIGNRNENMTPSKIFEYMSYGKPIISTLPNASAPSRVYLERYPLHYFFEEDSPDIVQEARRFEQWIGEVAGKTVPFSEVERAFYQNTPNCFCETVIGKKDSI